MTFRSNIREILYLFSLQLGLDPRRFYEGASALPRYVRSYWAFRKSFKGRMEWRPYLHDRSDKAGSLGEYFWQDLHVARMIAVANPGRHVDIGSRIDGFIGHLACFREVEVVDIRPPPGRISGVTFIQGDITSGRLGIAPSPSVSCLHTIEHFGLGRYGDTLDPDGMRKGLLNLAALVEPLGMFYVSTPIGQQRVVFNAHRISHPDAVLGPLLACGLELKRFAWVSGDTLHESGDIAADIATVAEMDYALGIFVLQRP
jgi:hypothetical protein